MKSLNYFFTGFFLTGMFLSLSLLMPTKGYSQVSNNGLVVAELFTSQSCSSCPAADKVLEKVAKNKNVITLSCHVTYWDHLHWKDTLSQKFCTARQKDFAKKINNTGRVYTPQLVINGHKEMVGSDKLKVITSVSSAAKQGLPNIKITQTRSDMIEANLPDISNGNFQLLLMAYHDKHVQSITSGENRGKTVAYTNSVTDIRDLGSWNGSSRFTSYNISEVVNKGDGIVILAQDVKSGKIAAAGRVIF